MYFEALKLLHETSMTVKLKRGVSELRMTWNDAFAVDEARQRRIQGVAFDIWTRGHLKRTRRARIGLALLSIVTGPIRLVFFLPAAFLEWLPRLIVSFGIALLLSFSFSLDGLLAGFLFCAILLWSYFSDIVRVVRSFLFDLFDLLSLGRVSSAFTRRNILVSLRNEDIENFQIKGYLIGSRPLISGEEAKEMGAFNDFLERVGLDLIGIDKAIEGYWSTESSTYWQDLRGTIIPKDARRE